MRSVVVAASLASACVMWTVAAIGWLRVRRMYRAAGAPAVWRADLHCPRWWMTSRLLSGFSIFTVTPLLVVNSYWSVVVFGAWVVQMSIFVWVTRRVGEGSEGAGPD